MKHIDAANVNSLDKLERLRAALQTDDQTFSIVVGGSLARGEASDESDIDYFFFGDDEESVGRATNFLLSKEGQISQIVGKPPSPDGAFGSAACETESALITDIGGNDDENEKITRRILFLLEGTWLTSKETFEKYRLAVLKRYVSETVESRHLCRFLLNDIIRYYRTICVDFEFKTVERNKEWGLRYIKLRYSRQFLYFSGIIAVAETVGLPYEEKIRRLIELFDMPPIERVKAICGTERASEALGLYNNFLEQISHRETRIALNAVTIDKTTHSDIFKDLQAKGRIFTGELSKILNETYAPDHVIHKALVF
jgi:hypothetical protein